jgi:hypothetical protein
MHTILFHLLFAAGQAFTRCHIVALLSAFAP